MKIKEIKQTPCTLKLNKTFCNAKNEYSIKESILIEIITDSITGYGEISPLEKFSNETFQEISWGLQTFIQAIDYNTEYSLNDILMLVEIYCNQIPSLHFGMDTALYDIASKKNKIPLSKFLSSTSCNNVKFSSLYSNQSHRKQYGTNTIKYKLGTNSLNQDIEILESISNHNKSIKFRLDANRNYTLGEFVNIYKKLEKFNVDYFEEPIKNLNIEKLKKIKNEFNIKIAIDESLYDGSDYKTWLKTDLINSIIIKPNIFGGYKKIFDLCRIGQNNNVKIIFSSSLESSIGNMASIHLAATLKDNQEHGLDIYNFYNTFSNNPIYKKNQLCINLEPLIGLGI